MIGPVTPVQESQYENPEKLAARAENIAIYRTLTGLHSIPAGRQYWTLASLQTTNAESEINQMVALSLCTKDQFVGVDMVEALIAQNKVNHPDATWYTGDWRVVVEDSVRKETFRPALVYLDMTSMADSELTADITYRTMKAAPSGTVILVNVALTNPYNGHQTEIDALLEHVTEKMTDAECSEWNLGDFPLFTYNGSGSTVMCTVGLARS